MKQNNRNETCRGEHCFRDDRLKCLADHLKSEQLFFPGKMKLHEIFAEGPRGANPEARKVISYALYELIHLYRDEWGINEDGLPGWIEDAEHAPISSAMKFFGISSPMFRHLFVPHAQDVKYYGGKRLRSDASPKEVANNIYAFIERIRAQQITRMYPVNLN